MPDAPGSFSHRTTEEFWACYRALLKADPSHPSLQFKKVGKVWSVRVDLDHRALATARPYGFLWFWIGPHAEYDRLIGRG